MLRSDKNRFALINFKKVILFFLMIAPAFAYAQVDTAILSDTLIQKIEESPPPPPQEEVTVTDQFEEEKTEYFLKKSDLTWHYNIEQRRVPDSIIKKMQQDDDFWYANTEIKEKQKPEEKQTDYTPLGQQQWVQTLLWFIIIGGFAAAIIWYLADSNVGLFRRKNKAIQAEVEEELETQDIFSISYQKEIDKAEATGNFRLAIRLMFLQLLKDLAEKNIIQYKQDKTNFDYLLQLQPSGYYNNFFRITRSYEYSWYGKFEVDEEAYRVIKNDFKQLNLQLN